MKIDHYHWNFLLANTDIVSNYLSVEYFTLAPLAFIMFRKAIKFMCGPCLDIGKMYEDVNENKPYIYQKEIATVNIST